MTYTIKIQPTKSQLAKDLLWYLKNLSKTKEYDFLHIIEEDDSVLTEEQKNELDLRYEHFLHNNQDYPDWEDAKQEFAKK